MTEESLRHVLHDLRNQVTVVLARLEALRLRHPDAAPDADEVILAVHGLTALLDTVAPGSAAGPPSGTPVWDEEAHGALRRCSRVLHVDDAPVSPLRALLVGRAGAEVEHVVSAAAAAALDREPVDLAVVDWWLGSTTAAGLLAVLADRGVPTVVMSGDPDAEAPARRLGAGFLRKPVPLRTLLDALVAALQR